MWEFESFEEGRSGRIGWRKNKDQRLEREMTADAQDERSAATCSAIPRRLLS